MSRPVTTEWRKTWVFAAQTELRQADLPGNLPRLQGETRPDSKTCRLLRREESALAAAAASRSISGRSGLQFKKCWRLRCVFTLGLRAGAYWREPQASEQASMPMGPGSVGTPSRRRGTPSCLHDGDPSDGDPAVRDTRWCVGWSCDRSRRPCRESLQAQLGRRLSSTAKRRHARSDRKMSQRSSLLA